MRWVVQSGLVVILCLGLCGPGASAWAQEPQSPKEQASVHFRTGLELFRIGAFAEALDAFEKSLALHANKKLYFNMGLAAAKLGDAGKAKEYFEAFAAAFPEHPAAEEATVRARAAQSQLIPVAAVRSSSTAVPAPESAHVVSLAPRRAAPQPQVVERHAPAPAAKASSSRKQYLAIGFGSGELSTGATPVLGGEAGYVRQLIPALSAEVAFGYGRVQSDDLTVENSSFALRAHYTLLSGDAWSATAGVGARALLHRHQTERSLGGAHASVQTQGLLQLLGPGGLRLLAGAHWTASPVEVRAAQDGALLYRTRRLGLSAHLGWLWEL